MAQKNYLMCHESALAVFGDEPLPLHDVIDRFEVAPVVLFSFGIYNDIFKLDYDALAN